LDNLPLSVKNFDGPGNPEVQLRLTVLDKRMLQLLKIGVWGRKNKKGSGIGEQM